MPDPARRRRTRAGEVYQQYRGAVDAWSARPRPFDPPPSRRRHWIPLMMESLAWVYLHNPTFREALSDEMHAPADWLEQLRQLNGGAFPSTAPVDRERPRCQRRLAYLAHHSIRFSRLVAHRALRQASGLELPCNIAVPNLACEPIFWHCRERHIHVPRLFPGLEGQNWLWNPLQAGCPEPQSPLQRLAGPLGRGCACGLDSFWLDSADVAVLGLG